MRRASGSNGPWSSSSPNTEERALKTHFNLTASEYEQARTGHLHRRRRDLVAGELAERAQSGDRVLEIGCGPGALLSDLASLHDDVAFLGIDVEPKMIAHARERHARDNVRYELVDLRDETPEEPADFAFSIDVLHHVGDLGAFLAGVHRSLRPHATWLAIEPNVFHPYVLVSQERMRRAGHDEDHFRPWRTEPLFTEAGFELLDRRYAFFFPGWMQRVPPAVARIEPPLERFRLLGGSVVYRLERAT